MVRTVRWSQVSGHSRDPASWDEFHVQLEVKGQPWNISKSTILQKDGASTDVPELRLLSCGEPWRRWDNVQALPFGGLKIKVIHHASGDFL